MPSAVALLLIALVPAGAAASATTASDTTAIDTAAAAQILFEADARAPRLETCESGTSDAERIACLLDVRYRGDARAARIARELYAKTGSVAGLLPGQSMDGAYRGLIHLVPHLPVKAQRKHLEWLTAAMTEIDAFLIAHAPPAAPGASSMRYRWRDLDVRFFRSVKRRTPSAFASGWRVAYNVSGSLFTSAARVRETLFHEIFHLNDFDHGRWSTRALADVYGRIVARCGTDTACLTPYAPDGIRVRTRGGTYYAFMPDNGVREYAADVAKRWYVEHRARWKGEKAPGHKPWKCLAPENAEAWRLVVDEFFAGVDRTPPCPG